MRSVLFVGGYGTVFEVTMCFVRNLRQNDDPLNALFCGTLSGLTIGIENPERRSHLIVYCMPRILEIMYLFFAKRKYLPLIPKWEYVLMSCGMMFYAYLRSEKPHLVKSSLDGRIFNELFLK
eukprot:TRINITY_DN2578_c0_g1_i1.p1 TRINITY_DN2578_c0_g1~~TRINITY_DN2578_c0_g1_i1.p1  ORF type:complete len:122 (-),score=18.69 TRINITY_DN2578_c0_g1_i1:63-428(-)